MKTHALWFCLAAAAVALCAADSARANAIINGNFATGDLTGWTTNSGGFGSVSVGSVPAPYAGSYDAAMICPGPGAVGMSQAFFANAGDILSFEYQYDIQVPGRYDSGLVEAVLRNGFIGTSMVYVISGGGHDLISDQWQEAFYQFPATGNYSIAFQAMNNSGFGSAFVALYVDDVQLTPEPATLGLLGVGLAALLARRRGPR
jgi:hypothetical protein